MNEHILLNEEEIGNIFNREPMILPRRELVKRMNEKIHEILKDFKRKYPTYPVFIEVTDRSDDTVYHGEILYYMENHKGWIIYDENHGGQHVLEAGIYQYREGYKVDSEGEIDKGVYVGYDNDYIERIYYYKGSNSINVGLLETL